MGLLINGEWHDQGYDTASHGGRFVRESAGFRRWVRPDPSAISRPRPAATFCTYRWPVRGRTAH